MSDQWFTDADVEAVLDDCLSLQFGKHDNEPVEVGMEAVIRHALAAVVPAKVAELQAENERLRAMVDWQLRRADKAEARLAAVAAVLGDPAKVKRVQEDRRRDLGAIVTTSMVTVADIRAAMSSVDPAVGVDTTQGEGAS